MKIFLISPNIQTLLNDEQQKATTSAGQVVFHSQVTSFEEVPGLFSGDEERILAIDPDFCDWKVSNEVIEKIPHLKAIVLQTTSFSWLDVDFAASKGIPVVNLRGFSSIAVAEWATMMMLNLARRVPIIIKDNWKSDYVRHQGMELRGKTAGIVGLGSIGTAIAENCQGLGMKVQYWSKHSRDERFSFSELSELMKTSDVVIPVVAQNTETKGLITDEMLSSMKPTALFISDIHECYNHQLLLDMVKQGTLYGYGFESAKPEMMSVDGNVWAGPELAWCTEDSMQKNAQAWTEAIVKAAKGQYPTQVN
jgi:glyoxylate reductase